MRDIGKNIKAIRQSKEMTQDALAEALYVTRQTVSNYENGRSRPDLDMLLKIADILGTDVNTIIYGPPIPKSKKDSYKRLAFSVGLLLLTGILYLTVHTIFSNNTVHFGYGNNIRWINKLTVLPVVMFVLGWTLLHSLSIFSNLQQLRFRRIRITKIAILLLLGLLIVIPVPFVIYLSVAVIRIITETSVEMTFPYIPVYHEIFWWISWLINHAPFVYTILGGVFWLLGLPKFQNESVNN